MWEGQGREEKERRKGEGERYIRERDKESSWLNGANIVIDNDSGSWCLQKRKTFLRHRENVCLKGIVV